MELENRNRGSVFWFAPQAARGIVFAARSLRGPCVLAPAEGRRKCANLYRSNGFRDVKVTSIVDCGYQGKPGQIAVTVNIVEGPQWLVNNLTINGVAQVDRKELESCLSSMVGQSFSEVNLASDRNQVLTYHLRARFP